MLRYVRLANPFSFSTGSSRVAPTGPMESRWVVLPACHPRSLRARARCSNCWRVGTWRMRWRRAAPPTGRAAGRGPLARDRSEQRDTDRRAPAPRGTHVTGARRPRLATAGMTRAVLGLCLAAALGCGDGAGIKGRFGRLVGSTVPDVAPTMANAESPFRYPPALWAQRLQGNVTLHLFVDSAGLPVADSIRIAVSSGMALFDSAAIAGAHALRFRPATRR